MANFRDAGCREAGTFGALVQQVFVQGDGALRMAVSGPSERWQLIPRPRHRPSDRHQVFHPVAA